MNFLENTLLDDHHRFLQEQEEMHYNSCLQDVLEAFQTHGIKSFLSEIRKNPVLNQELTVYIKSLQSK
jgi:hypothetical protein